jgi:hypothetical protein
LTNLISQNLSEVFDPFKKYFKVTLSQIEHMPVLLAGLDYITGEHPAFPLITMGLPSKSKILAGGLDVEEHVQRGVAQFGSALGFGTKRPRVQIPPLRP